MRLGLRIILSFLLFVIGFIPFPIPYLNFALFMASYLLVGYSVWWEAIQNIFKGEIFDEKFLMTLATIGAFAIGLYPEAVAVMLFYQVGEYFQDRAVDKSKKSIASLMELRPDSAVVLRNGKTKTVDPNSVQVGEMIVVKSGEKIPLDGVVVSGDSFLDTKALTGESVLRKVTVDDSVLSGCINGEGLLQIKVTKPFGESTVHKILDLVEHASSQKTKSENFITKFSRIYTPIVVLSALLLALIPPLITHDSYSVWLYRALSFLVVSCPCALVLSIPLSFFGGIGAASKIGVLVKGSNYLELLAKTDIMVFDKTGTLTEGVFAVQKVIPEGISSQELLYYAKGAEYYSNHPIALSIKAYDSKTPDSKKIKDVKEKSGFGVKAVVDGKQVLVGNQKWMTENKVLFSPTKEVGTVLYVSINGIYRGTIIIADQLKPHLENFIPSLKAQGISQTVLLTGDRLEIAQAVSKKLKIDTCYAPLLPQEKVTKMEALLKKKKQNTYLAFVGDGINDAPVLARSDLGIAMGGLGSDAAIEAADIVLLEDDPNKIVTCLQIAKRTLRIVHFNIFFVLLVKVIILLLSALGIMNLWISIFGDVGVTVLATLNALRVLNVKKSS